MTTARRAIPIENALVTVLSVDDRGAASLLYAVPTDRSGRTGLLPLPAPPRSDSLTPAQETPYAVYAVRVDHPQFQTAERGGLAVFEGIASLLPVSLLPLDPENHPQTVDKNGEG